MATDLDSYVILNKVNKFNPDLRYWEAGRYSGTVLTEGGRSVALVFGWSVTGRSDHEAGAVFDALAQVGG